MTGLLWLAEMAWYPTALLPSQGCVGSQSMTVRRKPGSWTEGRRPYFVGTVTALRFEFAP